MDKRNITLLAVAGVLILVALVYTMSRDSVSADLPTKYNAHCACMACKQHVRIAAKITDQRPYTCPECGERAVFPLFKCQDCGKYCVPNLMLRADAEFPSVPMIPSCSACGSQNIRVYIGTETIPSEEINFRSGPSSPLIFNATPG